jgi:hypothetical protein
MGRIIETDIPGFDREHVKVVWYWYHSNFTTDTTSLYQVTLSMTVRRIIPNMALISDLGTVDNLPGYYHVDPIIVIMPELITTTTRVKEAIILAQLCYAIWACNYQSVVHHWEHGMSRNYNGTHYEHASHSVWWWTMVGLWLTLEPEKHFCRV